ncbi:hypothetical protein M9H77_27975 [Catharanthus roseus]|uniref:Uncharacterized protein n=1 Tax=Catharanthus roseus TaxID=4058 RepID=A0ACC0AFH4_CATRO|nr:hypothetical protein M9H77_27975 [Catharanthus roseus]
MYVVIPSVVEPLVALPLLHYVFGDRVDRIYRIQGSLELSFFWVIVIIRFKLNRNSIISVRSINLIVIIIDVTAVMCSGKVVARIQQEYESLPSIGWLE